MYKILCSDGTVLYDQSDVNTTRVATEPQCTREIGQNSSTLSFSMLSDHPAYDSIRSMETYLSAEEDNEEIFYGRVTEIRTEQTTGVKQISCTGSMSFLDDFELPPIPNGEQNMTAADFFRRCINGYATELGNDPKRAFGVGTINHSKSNVRREFGMTSYTKVKSALDTYIIKEFGGYLRIRKDGNTHVIDWLESYGVSNASPIELANNVITHENAITSNDFFTVIHPLGKDSAGLPEVTVNVDDALVATYGRIVKTVSFANAKNAEELRSEVNEYKTKMAKGLGKTCNVKLIDVHFLDNTVGRIQLGAVYTNISGFSGEDMTVFSMEQHFENPSEDKVVLKNHRELSAVKNGSSTGKISKIISSAFENIHKHITETAEMLSIHADLIELHGISIQETAQEFARYSRATDSTIGDILGTGVLQNSDHITQVAGNFTSKYGGVSNTRLSDLTQKGISPAAAGFYELEAIEITEDMIGSGIEVFGSPNGALNGQALDTSALTVGQIVYRAKFTTDASVTPGKTYYVKTISVGKGTEVRISEDGQEINVYDSIDNVQEGLLTVTGSSFWTQRDNITGVVGQFQIEEDPETHVRRLVVVSGGGMKILRDNVEYGVYDNGNLTGGIIVEKINDVGTVTKISGDKVVIGSGQTQQVLTTAIDNITDFVGEFDVVEDPNTGVKTIVLTSGGGMKVRRGTTEFGIFDNGNLTGGIVVDKINGQGGSGTLTQIRGEFVDITADQVRIGSTSNVANWMSSTGQDISNLQGLVADRATIAQLNAQKARIDTLETDALTAQNIQTSYLSSAAVSVWSLSTNAITGTTLTLSSTLHAGNSFLGDVSATSLSSEGSVNGAAIIANGNDISNPLVGASVSGTNNDTLTLTYADGSSVTFRKAATTAHLVGNWRGNIYEVYADNDPNVLPVSVELTPHTGTGQTLGSYTINTFDSSYKAYANVTAPGVTGPLFGFNIDASSVYTAGETAGEAAGWEAGYDDARAYVSMPGQGTSTSFTVKIPNAARDGQETHTFTMTKGTPSASGGYAAVHYGTGAVAQISLSDWWIGGVNSVTLSAGGWQNGANRVSASNGEYVDVALPSFSTSGGTSFSSHKTTVHFTTPSVTGPVKSVEVDATSEYNAGVTAGYNSAKLSGSFSGAVWTVTKGTTGTNSVSLTLSATASLSYDATTHKYTATGYARASNANRATSDPVESGTQAYDAGVTAGNTAGYNSAKLSGSFSGAVWTVSKGTTGTDSVSLTLSATAAISYDSSTHKYTATGYARASNANRATSDPVVSGTEAYEAGEASVTGTAGSWSSGSLTVTLSNSNTVSVSIPNATDWSISNSAAHAVTVSCKVGGKSISKSWTSLGYVNDHDDSKITAAASISYNSTTHKYTANASAKYDSVEKATASSTGGTEAYTAGVNAVTISSVEVYGSPAATATTITMKATASNNATGTGSVDISSQRTNAYNSGYNAGWADAAAKFKRTGNTVYGPSAAAGGSDRSFTANYSASSCVASKYSASTFQQASYTAEVYTASSCTPSSYSAGYHYYKAPSYTPSSATSLGGGMYSNYVASKYSAPTHYYTAPSYTAEEYTESSIKASTYTAATYSASTYTKEVYTASSFSWS